MKYLNGFFREFRLGSRLTNKSQAHIIYAVAASLLAVTSALMTVINIKREFYLMAVITGILAAALLLCAYLSGVRKMKVLPSVIMAVGLIPIFSYFAISGQNQGFAILWILLVPMFATSIMDMRIGIGISVYFLFFSLVLFYTPMREYVTDNYSEAFMERFPILYICDFIISIFIFMQKEFYSRKLQIKSNMDELTGAYNRSYFTNFILNAPMQTGRNTCVMLIDINGLKEVNDTLGHEAGDELICAVPHCCGKVLESEYTLCRIGGDEFVLITHQPEGEIAALVAKLKAEGEKWRGGHSLEGCYLSIGWASSEVYPEDSAVQLYGRADAMMYEDKAKYYTQEGKDRRQ